MPIGRPLDLTANVATKKITVMATAGQTSFTVNGGYRIGQIGVYRNGVRLVDSKDFSATDGSKVTLVSAATVNDAISFDIFDSFNIANTIIPNASDQTINGNLTVTGDLVSQGGINTSSNVGFGTTRPDSIARSNNSVILNAGIVTAYEYYGDVSNCTGAGAAGVSTTGFSTFTNISVGGISTFTGAIDANSTSDFGGNVTVSAGELAVSAGNLKVTAGIASVGAGVTISSDFIHLTDNSKIQLGIASDLAIYHNGSHSVIQNATGSLLVEADSCVLRSQGQENYLVGNANGTVDIYHNGVAKFNTAGAGVSVTGGVQVSSGGTFGSHNANAAVYYGDGSNLTGISTAAVPGISTQLHSVFGTINASGIITASSSIKVSGISSIFVGNSLGGDGTREGAFIRKHSIGIGTTTTVGRAAGVGTQVGTLIYDVNEEGVQVYNGLAWKSVADVSNPFSASGGTKSTTDRSNWTVHTFNATGTLVVTGTPMPAADYLIIGGGAGGGYGGGGGGGYRTSTTFPIVPGTYTISVGGGGAGSNPGGGGVGTPSYVDHPGISSITSEGGGGGAGGSDIGAQKNGGSGGGGSRDGNNGGGGGDYVAGTNTPAPEQGNNGGQTGGSSGFRGASGGGGAGGTGGSGSGNGQSGNERAGNGGNGTASSIDGESLTRGAGGGGGSQGTGPNSTGLGGQGGGGRGGHQQGQNPTSGTDNFGGGGGGNCTTGGIYCPTGGGQQGGSGTIIIAYPTPS